MDKMILKQSSVSQIENNGSNSPVEVNPYFGGSTNDIGVTVVESNGNSVVLMKQISNMPVTDHTSSMLPTVVVDNINNSSSGLSSAIGQKSPPSGLISSDIEFTSLLSKHLYSTTMTGSGAQSSEQVATEVKTSPIAECPKESLPLVVLPAQNQINVHPDLLRLGSLLNNQNLILGNGQAMPQIIYVPILAAPALPSPANEAAAAAGTPVSPILTNHILPLNYGMIGALPLTSATNNINNIVYVQPQPTTLFNPVIPQQAAMTPISPISAQPQSAPLVTLVQAPPPSSLLNIAGVKSPPTSLLNILQPSYSNVNIAGMPVGAPILNPAEKLMTKIDLASPTQSVISETNVHKVASITNKDTKKRGQKRKLSRNKSCSSDASSVDSSMTVDAPPLSNSSCKQTPSTSSSKKKKVPTATLR